MDMNAPSPTVLTSSTPRRHSFSALALGIAMISALPLAAHAASDEAALTELLKATGGLASSPLVAEGWGSGQHCDDWKGVTCTGGRVTHLDLANYDLEGVLPVEIGDLDQLKVLDLSNNRFSGKIPDSIGKLTQLEELSLDRNAFEGAVPVSMKALTALTKLDISYNMLSSSNADDTDTFLTEKQGDDWQATQTVAPTGLAVTGTTIDSISLEWTPIAYTADGGKYEIIVSPDADLSIDDDVLHKSDDKTSSKLTIAGLTPSTEYHLAIRTRTDSIPGTGGQSLVSSFSPSVSAFTLLDTDRDGVADINDSDADNDGIPNDQEGLDKDSDGDGIKDYLEPNNIDTDGDGDPNYLDDDDDNDGNITLNELGSNPDYPADSDNNGIRDYLDADSKNAGGTSDGSGDSDQDGLSDKEECPSPANCADSDGDGLPNYMDSNDDNDKLDTASEGATLDSDSDGVIDALESNSRDTDGDGIKDHEDPDDDGDGRPTRDELGADALEPRDKDGDNIPDYLDADSDNKAETKDGSGDSDGDGISDYGECPTAPACTDADGDGVPSYMDTDEKTEVKLPGSAVLGDSDTKSGGGGGSLALSFIGIMSGFAAAFRRRIRQY